RINCIVKHSRGLQGSTRYRPFLKPPDIRQPVRISLSSSSKAYRPREKTMLWGIDPLLTADLLYALRRMGHGDEIVVVDANFPADSTAMSTVIGEPIPLAGVNAARAVEAILSVMPLDTFVPDPACRMEIVGDADTMPPVQREVQQA